MVSWACNQSKSWLLIKSQSSLIPKKFCHGLWSQTSSFLEFLIDPTIPSRYLTKQGCDADVINPAYSDWEQQDLLLFTWFLSMLSEMVLPRVVHCVHSWQVWQEIHKFFHSQMSVHNLINFTELKSITKREITQLQNLARIQAVADILLSREDTVSHCDHINDILEGLPEEYSPLAAIIQYHTEPCDIL